MRFAYKVIKNKNRVAEEIKNNNAVAAQVVSFIMVAKVVLGFRECAEIIKIAEETNCTVQMTSGKKSGSSDSIMSLVSLGILADKSLVLTIKGENKEDAFHRISKIINGEVKL